MSQFTDNFASLRGRVQSARPGILADFVNNALNDRLRQILDVRTFWSDLLKFGILSFPDPYTTGVAPPASPSTVSLATGSNVVTGDGSNAWPVSDVVNTIIPDGVADFGYVEVTPASMNGIVPNGILYVDAGGDPEVAPIVEVNRTNFIAKFSKTHNTGCTITQSSLANQQFRLNQSYPVFTVAAVTAADSLILTLPWGGPPLAAQTYTIKVMYVMLAPDLKAVIAMKDEQTGYPVRVHVAVDEADNCDPRRTQVSGNPYYALLDLGANDQGNMLYEVWPAPGNARQFSYAYWKQWPDMVLDTDRPPPFINPSILFYGALADAKMMRLSKEDAYYDPQGAQYYEGKFMQAVQDARNADECKRLEAMRSPWWRNMTPGNYDQWQLNEPQTAGFWSGY
jgi:hypothetical protein